MSVKEFLVIGNVTASSQTCLRTVPRRMNLPEALVTGRAVFAVRGVLMACSIVPGRPDCVLGLTNPVIGRPDCVIGLGIQKRQHRSWSIPNFVRDVIKTISMPK